MLDERQQTVTYFRCDFCGTIHVSRQQAEAHGCTAESPPAQLYKVGDEVTAKFTVAHEGKDDRWAWLRGRITEVIPPVQFGTGCLLGRLYGAERVDDTYIRFCAESHVHNWMVHVQPLEQPENGEVMDEWFYQSEKDGVLPKGRHE